MPPPDFGLTRPSKDTILTSGVGTKVCPATETLPAREVFHKVQAAIRPLLNHAQTREQVDQLLQSLSGIAYEEHARATIHDPTPIWHKGRPRTQRLTGATEARVAGGGGQTAKRRREKENHDAEEELEEPPSKKKKTIRRCRLCKREGHYRSTCPLNTK
ncbi:hypothetical protein FB45DRAFT_751755 [Roridomyces roridus]|uniref:Eukaryotic translation initiation factor 3 subunit G N-terminal domain-containing protein n=1 Tax=Roridomyces roridus TaxID=1738132 RepID=A0AAD7BLG1_9AGAR|nr:hypothetical protein FB45DRAFT_751755 [Roridomyces roridus]